MRRIGGRRLLSSICSREEPFDSSYAAKIDGRSIAEEIKLDIARCIQDLKSRTGLVPGLAMLQAGQSPQSVAYAQKVQEACIQVGMHSHSLRLPAGTQQVVEALRSLNTDTSVHGIVLQLPLPQHIQAETVLREICMDKDVDGLHPMNLGKLALGTGTPPTFWPCTALGCLELLSRHKVQLESKHAVVIGCSNVVGLPIALLLQRYNATVTIIDRYTTRPAELARQADILVSATGNANLVRGNWIKPGAVVIDVGMNMVQDSSSDAGIKFLGDVCFEEAQKIASAITPVPGGVGPVTVAMLLSNTLLSAQRTVK